MSAVNDVTNITNDEPGSSLDEKEVTVIPKFAFIVPYRDRKEH